MLAFLLQHNTRTFRSEIVSICASILMYISKEYFRVVYIITRGNRETVRKATIDRSDERYLSVIMQTVFGTQSIIYSYYKQIQNLPSQTQKLDLNLLLLQQLLMIRPLNKLLKSNH